LNNWVRWFNQQGIDGLIEGVRTGRPPKIAPEQSDHYRQLIEQLERLDQALLWVMNRTGDNQRTCSLERFT
jgi:transposase